MRRSHWASVGWPAGSYPVARSYALRTSWTALRAALSRSVTGVFSLGRTDSRYSAV